MAANEYYHDPYTTKAAQQYRPVQKAARPLSHIAYSYNPSHSSSSLDQSRPTYGSRPESNFYESNDASRHSLYSDSIPLKHKSKLDISQDDWRTHGTQYPPSPDSHTQLNSSEKKKKNRFCAGKIPWVVYVVSLVQVTVFVVEIIKNSIITGSPIMIHPQFNPMIGPSTYVQINMGARFVPCMRVTPGVQDSPDPPTWPCPNTTTSDPLSPSNHCDLKALCGFSGFDNQHPNQWFRFIVPMFLHAGLIHIAFNLLLQLTMGREMEKAIGSIRFALVYFSSGIFGFVLGGNFAATAIASTGASGCLFGILALVLLDLIYGWNERRHPVKDLMWILVDIVISFVLGLLPGLDNFSHIGGFLMGLAAGICILHSPNVLRQRIGETTSGKSRYHIPATGSSGGPEPKATILPDSSTPHAVPADMGAFAKRPVGFFKGRKPLWWAWWLFRLGALIGVLVAFVVLLNNFYKYHDTCSWCKYLSCLPINNWCEIGNLQLNNAPNTTNGTSSGNDLNSRGLFAVGGDWDTLF